MRESFLAVALALAVLAVAVLGFAACGQKGGVSELQAWEIAENAELGCAELSYDGVVYRPFGAVGGELLGEKIGVCGDVFVYSAKGYDSGEWVCDVAESGLMDAPMLWKAVGVAEVPEGLAVYRAYDF